MTLPTGKPIFCLRDFFIFQSAIGLGILCSGLIALGQGTSLTGLVNGIVLQHTAIGAYKYASLFAVALPMTIISAFFAWQCLVKQNRQYTRWIDFGVLALVACLILRQFTDSFLTITHGGNDRSLATMLTSVMLPFVWVILVPVAGTTTSKSIQCRDILSRVLLGAVAMLQPMQAFPIPGTQVGLGSFCLVIVLLVAFSDGIKRGLVFSGDASTQSRIGSAFIGCLLMVTLVRDVNYFQYRNQCEYLNLPGTRNVKLPPERVEQIRWVVAEIRSSNSTFLGAPNGYHSFYFWAEKKPPTLLNATFWPTLLNHAQQQEIIDQLKADPQVVVLAHQNAGDWQSLQTPLVRYLVENYRVTSGRDHHEIWQKKSE